MDGFEEKKWFVYMGDHHEGPFSLADIQGKMTHGHVTSSHYIWMEGMPDWKIITEIPAFESLLSKSQKPPLPIALPIEGTAADKALQPELQLEISSPKINISSTQKKETPLVSTLSGPSGSIRLETVSHNSAALGSKSRTDSNEADDFPPIEDIPPRVPLSMKIKKLLPFAILTLLIGGGYFSISRGYLDPVLKSPTLQAGIRLVSDMTKPHLLTLAEKFPTLNHWISPIPYVEDVTPEEYEELRQAAATRIEKGGAKIAAALAQGNVSTPSFYITSNLPDGAVFNVFLEGVLDTLLNQREYSTKIQSILNKKFSKTGPVTFTDGKPLPQGQYQVVFSEAEAQPPEVKAILALLSPSSEKVPLKLSKELKLVTIKSYFLGGKKDAVYMSRLKEFHDMLRKKTQTELAEIKQFMITLNAQLAETMIRFSTIQKMKITLARKRAWIDFQTKSNWSKLWVEIEKEFVKWTPNVLQNERFLGVLSQLTLEAGKTVRKVHDLQGQYFIGNSTSKQIEQELGQAISLAQTALTNLKVKVEQAEKQYNLTNGLPQREGL